MTRVDRYILFLFLRVLIICFLCMIGLLIIVHAFTNLEELVAYGKVKGSLPAALFAYYGPYSLVLLDRFIAMLALLALLFVVSWLKRTNELTVMMAAGVGPRRVLRYPILASLFLFAAVAINRELLIPRFEETLGKNPQDLSAQHLRPVRPVHDAKYGILFGGRYLNVGARELLHPSLRLEGPAAKLGRQLLAEKGRYLPADEHHPAGILLEGITLPVDFDRHPSLFLDANPILFTSADQPWLKPGEGFIVTSIEFAELQGGSSWKQYASTAAMIGRLRAPSSHIADDLRLSVHQRFVQPMLDFTLLLMGIPILLRQQERHFFWVAGVTLMTVGIFFVCTKLIHSLASGATNLPPYLGAWLPLLIFAPIAYARAQAAFLR